MNPRELLRDNPLRRRWPTLLNVMAGRLALFALILLVQLFLLPHQDKFDRLTFFWFLGIALCLSIPYLLWLRREETARVSAPAQFAIDVVIITGLVHFTGGRYSEMTLLYPLVILVAGIVFSGRLAVQVALLCATCYTILVLLESQGLLEYYGKIPFPYGDYRGVLLDIVIKAIIFGFFTLAAMFVTDLCILQREKLGRLQSLGQILFDTVKAPLLAINRNGRILIANHAANELLTPHAALPAGVTIADLFPAPPPTIPELLTENHIREMQTSAGLRFPALVGLQPARIRLSDLNQDAATPAPEDSELYVMLFQDLSPWITPPAGDNLQAAAGMVAEMAHEVRNPLTAIRGAGELLGDAAGTIARQQRAMTPTDWNMITALCDVISQESARLDGRLQDYLDRAETDPARLRDNLRQANGWARRIPLYPPTPETHP
ncbi:MAG: histidine kinase dimerization/phospho-acceptor domain-containing protein [Lentisphaeria bacterium]|jgi:two-component system sensor histidine kinase PilS (NtrC family)